MPSDDRIPAAQPWLGEHCQLDKLIVLGILMAAPRTELPCDGCNHDRAVCGGGPRRQR